MSYSERYWTQREIERLIQLYPKYTAPQIAYRFGRSVPAIENMLTRLRKKGLVQHKNSGWMEHLDYLKENIEKKTYPEMSKELGRSWTNLKQVIYQYRKKGLL